MEEGLGLITAVAGIIQLSFEALRIFRDVIPNQYYSLQRSYGHSIAVLVIVLLRDTATQYERVESVVLPGQNEDVLAFRQAVTDECSMTAVAVG